MPWEASYVGAEGVYHSPAEGNAGGSVTEGVYRMVAAVGNRRMGGLCGRRVCAGRVCHSPAEGVCQRVVSLLGVPACHGRPPMWEPEGCVIVLQRGNTGGSVTEGCAGGVCRIGAVVGNRRMRRLCWRTGAPEGCAIALPRGRAGRGRRRVSLESRCRPMWAEGCAGGCHSPAEGVRWRACDAGDVPEVCRCLKPPHALGGLLCGRR